ncbi:MAG: hypothetical protein A2X93_09340 [Deltaproteobacteria bacterium GWC2_56_8]|nr:MAG: hypothetical protein A2X93_09340 [Deltaproteobacteria bacterium GWC2_56_8]
MLRLPDDIVEPVLAMVTSSESDCIKGIGKLDGRLLILLNVDKILSRTEHDALGSHERHG